MTNASKTAISIGASKNPRRVSLHVIPCKIHHTGSAKVGKYFPVKHLPDEKHYEAYFRGRRLLSDRFDLKDLGYTGMMMPAISEAKASQTDEYSNDFDDYSDYSDEIKEKLPEWNKKAEFNEVYIWGHDSAPENNNDWVDALREWITFTQAVS
ncbi:ribonuclease H2, subunit C [Lipomyces oligophaga]|uniref:ribonuclease H2, subunit C n=1 Tax=Lipomyces oligophaga TaxID=45792 RepID=UPI0034CDD712